MVRCGRAACLPQASAPLRAEAARGTLRLGAGDSIECTRWYLAGVFYELAVTPLARPLLFLAACVSLEPVHCLQSELRNRSRHSVCVECFPYILLLCFFAEGRVLIKDNDNVVRLNLKAKFRNISVLWFTFPFLDVKKKK